ncbi:hypothetical protein TSUD_400680 [Trifolium subterraneum]|uniref:Replication factor A C-terminal domain-containing protein n=1 Tax=Trifolium subterraneum TaxID=3900 RepID=A0A2Z6PAD0_TRISU|nr:hypothetical protein TSUD_400680 [Trifolium subterraneum]
MVVVQLDNDGYRFKCTLFGRASVHNTIYSTKILFNPVFSAAVDLKKRMIENNDTPSPGISRLQDDSKISLMEDFIQVNPYSTIECLKESHEGVFVVCATIKVIVDDNDWWYTTCICNKKVYPDERMYFCDTADAAPP